jgi:hypothetical protein
MGSPQKSKQSRLPPDGPRKLVWRMTASVPMGEWVPAGSPIEPLPRLDLPEVSDGNWVTSSYDLLDGVRVVESGDTISDPLMDELFGPQWAAARSSGQPA